MSFLFLFSTFCNVFYENFKLISNACIFEIFLEKHWISLIESRLSFSLFFTNRIPYTIKGKDDGIMDFFHGDENELYSVY